MRNRWRDRRVRSVPNESLDGAPPNEDHVVIDEGRTKLGAGNDVEIALAPGSIPNRKVHGDGSHLRVVVREMNEELADAGLEMLDDIDVVACHANGQSVLSRHLPKHREQSWRGIERVHVGIEMCGFQAHGPG